MDNPQQVLLHLTSRGAKVRTLEQGAIGKFTNMATQPINNINKYGLLHYSIPKQMDLLNDANRSFTLRIRFHSGKFIDIPVILPAMDYYGMRLDYATDDARSPRSSRRRSTGRSRSTGQRTKQRSMLYSLWIVARRCAIAWGASSR